VRQLQQEPPDQEPVLRGVLAKLLQQRGQAPAVEQVLRGTLLYVRVQMSRWDVGVKGLCNLQCKPPPDLPPPSLHTILQ